MTKIQVF